MKMMRVQCKGFILVFISLICACHSDSRKSDRENDLMLNISDKYNRENNPDQSLIEINDFLKNYPNSFIGWNFAAIVHLAMGSDSLAWECVGRSIDLNDSTNYGAFTNKAILLDKMGQFDSAYEYYKKSILIKPEYAQTYSNLMSNRMKVRQLDSAIYYGEISVRLAGNIGDQGILCALYHKVGLFEKRDSLYLILKHLEYENLDKLEEVIIPVPANLP